MDVVVNKIGFVFEGIWRGLLISVGGFGLFSMFFVGDGYLPLIVDFMLFLLVSIVINLDNNLFFGSVVLATFLTLYLIIISYTTRSLFPYSEMILALCAIALIYLFVIKLREYRNNR